MMTSLTTNQERAVDAMPATARELADVLGYATTSGVYKLLKRAERRDPTYRFTSENGVWDYERVATDGGMQVSQTSAPADYRPPGRLTTGEKSSRTKAINDWLVVTERALAERLASTAPVDVSLPQRDGNLDMVMFRTDDHFGARETELTAEGEIVEVFNSAIAAERVQYHYAETVRWKRELEAMGYSFDTFTLLLNGDHITGEDIFPGQAHYLDATLRTQMEIASDAYIDVIRSAADEFPGVRVVCQHGNHGELRTGGHSADANADDLLYDRLNLAVRQADLGNIDYLTNTVATHTEFPLRTHRAQMRHGQDGLGHIGTSSAQKRWLAWLHESADRFGDAGWDVAYQGHYHQLKMEPIAGRPVLMGGTLCPAGDYEDSLGIAPGRPGAWSHTVSDAEAVEQLKPVYFPA